MGPRKPSLSRDLSESESPSSSRPSSSKQHCSSKQDSSLKRPPSPQHSSLPKRRRSAKCSSSHKHLPSKGPSSPTTGTATPQYGGPSTVDPSASIHLGIATHGAVGLEGIAWQHGDSVIPSSDQAAGEYLPENHTLHVANSQNIDTPYASRYLPAPGLIGLTAIRQQEFYPGLTRGRSQPLTPPTSLTSSLEVEVDYDGTPTPTTSIDMTVYELQVPWDCDEILLGVGAGFQPHPSQFPHDGYSVL